MISAADLIELLDFDPLVPQGYAAYRPLVAEGVAYFLSRLPPGRLAAIVAEQLDLPEDAAAAERIVALLRHCPTLHKLGQVVARDRRLDVQLRRRLQELESLPPRVPMDDIRAMVRRELGDANIKLAPGALAEASVAVVAPFTWRPAAADAPGEGVLKVLKPGVEERLHEELAIWSDLGGYLEERSRVHGLPAVDYRETLDSVRDLLGNEIRLDREQRHLVAAARFHDGDPQVIIPRLLPFCTPRITAMTRIRGVKVTDAALSPRQRRRLAGTVFAALVAKPFW
ncbi:MAG: AarF/UbiB family protein, partial [Pseudomonadota bacterium]|nr:AarF/UbiB family protein [Pseudomonadota bacterium]